MPLELLITPSKRLDLTRLPLLLDITTKSLEQRIMPPVLLLLFLGKTLFPSKKIAKKKPRLVRFLFFILRSHWEFRRREKLKLKFSKAQLFSFFFCLSILGIDNTFTIQSRDRFDKDVAVGRAHAISGSAKAHSGIDVVINSVDNVKSTYTCGYPGTDHTLGPQLNGELIKDAPFTFTTESGEADMSMFELLWGDLAHDGATVVAGVERKFLFESKVNFLDNFSIFFFFFLSHVSTSFFKIVFLV